MSLIVHMNNKKNWVKSKYIIYMYVVLNYKCNVYCKVNYIKYSKLIIKKYSLIYILYVSHYPDYLNTMLFNCLT